MHRRTRRFSGRHQRPNWRTHLSRRSRQGQRL